MHTVEDCASLGRGTLAVDHKGTATLELGHVAGKVIYFTVILRRCFSRVLIVSKHNMASLSWT